MNRQFLTRRKPQGRPTGRMGQGFLTRQEHRMHRVLLRGRALRQGHALQ